jgi:hypothetical protein
MEMLAVMSPVMWKWLSICRLHPGAGCISLSLFLSLNFSTFECSYVYRISVQETVTDYLPIQRNRDFVFSYSCYASQCGLLKNLRPLHFWLVTMFQMVNIDLWIQTLSKKLATQSQSWWVNSFSLFLHYSQGMRQVVVAKPSQIWIYVWHLS